MAHLGTLQISLFVTASTIERVRMASTVQESTLHVRRARATNILVRSCEQHKFKGRCRYCQRTLIIARAALGDAFEATETRKKEKRPPLRGDSSGLYDSIVVKPGRIQGHHSIHELHQEFVFFDGEQAYPSYVVQYTI